jgi:hypothetical protein
MGALFHAAAVFYFRQALLQLNAIHKPLPSLERLGLATLTPLYRLMLLSGRKLPDLFYFSFY